MCQRTCFASAAEEAFAAIARDAWFLPHPLRPIGCIADVAPVHSNAHADQLEPKVNLKVEASILFVVLLPFFSLMSFHAGIYNN